MARSFSGTAQYIDCGGAAGVLNISGAKTVSCWIYPTTLPTVSTEHYSFFSKGYDGSNQGWDLTFRADALVSNQPSISFASAATPLSYWTYGASMGVNNWYHITGLHEGTNAILYVNTVQRASIASTSTQSNDKVAIGAIFSSGVAVNLFKGRIADAAVWNTNLSAAERAALYAGIRPPRIRPASLVGYWPVDGLETAEPDLSGNRNNGTVTGAAYAFGPPVMTLSGYKANMALTGTFPPRQAHYRFRTDANAADAAPTWGANEDAA